MIFNQEKNFYLNSYKLRLKILEMVKKSNGGHIGGSYSVIDILNYLYSNELNHFPNNPKSEDRDFLIYSKGHSSLALYSTLSHFGYFPETTLDYYNIDGGTLAGHPEKDIAPGIEVTSGSLGHGQSIGVGLSLSLKTDNRDNRVFVISSDGEFNEGSVWEACLSASQFKLKNFYLIIDYNKLISLDYIKNIMSIEPLFNKLESFGFDVYELDGHNFKSLSNTFNLIKKNNSEKPKCIIANTIKGKGVSFMENITKWHFRSPTDDEFEKAKIELKNNYERRI